MLIGAETQAFLYRDDGSAAAQNIAIIYEKRCLDADCRPSYLFAATQPWVDLVAGTITMVAAGCEVPDDCCSSTCDLFRGSAARVRIIGLPKLFDTLLTFLPAGQMLSIMTPAHPDGFRSADSLQVWTGDVQSIPNWSQATPVACGTATNPIPGQVVSVPDTHSDPEVGQSRYYLVASQSGTERRLGRQYVGGAFSARELTGLPGCQ